MSVRTFDRNRLHKCLRFHSRTEMGCLDFVVANRRQRKLGMLKLDPAEVKVAHWQIASARNDDQFF